MQVTVVNRQRRRRVGVAALQQFVERMVAVFPPTRADRIGVALVSDERMRGYNRAYRGKDATTDVLAFPAGCVRDPEGGRPLGDIAISVPRAAFQARECGHAVSREIQILVIHGYLHLLGFDHETDDGAMEMTERALARRLAPRRGEP